MIFNVLKGHSTQHSGHMVKIFQNEVMVRTYSKSLVQAIGKVLHLEHQLKPIKVMKNGCFGDWHH